MANRHFSIIVAATTQNGIGLRGGLPWKLKGDMAFFKETTSKCATGKQNAVIMGRKTWESIPAKFRPLPDRLNVVISSQDRQSLGIPEDVRCASGVHEALTLLSGEDAVEKVFVIGGGRVYKDAIAMPECEKIFLTRVKGDMECDTFFPSLEGFRQGPSPREGIVEEGGIEYEYLTYVRGRQDPTHAEWGYLDLVRDIMENGNHRGDRTGTGTISKFGCSMRFDLKDSFPLLTTKRVFWRGVAEELLWFVAGRTNSKLLAEKGIKIWDGNGSREFLDQRGLSHREEGDLGPVYGFQWRHFGAEYVDMHADYTGKGYDQLAKAIDSIKNNPTDRRIIISAWNPADLDQMALPPCHMFCQFYVCDKGLSCQMYQRSCDMGLGVPFNIASYALLTRMMAHVCDLPAHELILTMGDAHVYKNHVGALHEQLAREPRPFPQLTINRKVTDIDDFKMEDFTIEGYDPHKKIAMKMAV